MIRTTFYFFAVFILFIGNVFSEIVKDFKIEGNQRVSESTIINFSEVKLNTDLNPNQFNKVIDFFKENDIQYINAELTLRADTLVDLDQDMSEKVLNIMEFMDDLDDVQEVHTNAEFPENFEIKE